MRSEGSPLPRPPWYQAPPRTPNANGVVSPGTRNRQPIGIARHQPKSPHRGGFCETKGGRSRGHPGTRRRHARLTPKALFLREPGIDNPSGSPDINPNHPNGVVSAKRRVAAPAATLVPAAAMRAQRPRRCFSGNPESTSHRDRPTSTQITPTGWFLRGEGSPLPRPPWYQAPPRTPNAQGVVSPGTRNRQPAWIARHQPDGPHTFPGKLPPCGMGPRAHHGYQGSPGFTSASPRYAETAPLGHVRTANTPTHPIISNAAASQPPNSQS